MLWGTKESWRQKHLDPTRTRVFPCLSTYHSVISSVIVIYLYLDLGADLGLSGQYNNAQQLYGRPETRGKYLVSSYSYLIELTENQRIWGEI